MTTSIINAKEKFLARKFPLHSWVLHAQHGTVQVVAHADNGTHRVIRTQDNDEVTVHVNTLTISNSPFDLMSSDTVR
jgi:hypothetical protein